MAQALIRNIEDDLLDHYRQSARSNGRSLEAELREALKRARPGQTDRKARFRQTAEELRAMTPDGPTQSDSTLIIRRYRDTNGGR